MYEKQKFGGERFGKVDFFSGSNLGQAGSAGLPEIPVAPAAPVPTTSTADSVGMVLTGIGALLNPLAAAGVGIYKTKLDADAARKAMKAEVQAQQIAMMQQQQAMLAAMQQQQMNRGGSGSLVVLGIAGLGAAILAIIFVNRRKKD